MDVRLPNGLIIRNVPDGTSKSDLRMKLLKNGVDPDGPAEKVDPTEGMSGAGLVLAGVGKSVADTGRGLGQLVGAVDQSEVDEARNLDEALTDNPYGLAGSVIGAAGQVLAPGGAVLRVGKALNSAKAANAGRGLMAPKTVLGNAAQGAAFGATQPVATGETRGGNVALGALGGAAGGAAGKLLGGVARPLSNKLTPEEQRLVSILEDEGVPLLASQKTGTKPLVASAMENLPLTAGPQREVYGQQSRAFTEAVMRRAGLEGSEATDEVLTQGRKGLGKEFERLSSGRTVPLGDGMLNKLTDLDAAQTELRGVLDTEKIDALVSGMLDKLAKGSLSGEAAQAMRSEMTKEIRNLTGSQAPGASRLADALREIRNGIDDAIHDALTPQDRALWAEARRKYGNVKAIQKAMLGTKTDVATKANVSPVNLLNTVQTRGPAELKDLAKAGLMLRSPVGDSGTAQRLLWQGLLTGGGLGGSVASGDPTYLAATGGALLAPRAIQAALLRPSVQKYLERGVAPNSPKLAALAEALRRGAVAGSPALALETQK